MLDDWWREKFKSNMVLLGSLRKAVGKFLWGPLIRRLRSLMDLGIWSMELEVEGPLGCAQPYCARLL